MIEIRADDRAYLSKNCSPSGTECKDIDKADKEVVDSESGHKGAFTDARPLCYSSYQYI